MWNLNIKLWYITRGDFVKEIEMPIEYEPKHTFSLIRYEREFQKLKKIKWVFVQISENEYEFDHKEDYR